MPKKKENPAASLVPFVDHYASCARNSWFMMSCTYNPRKKCTCGLADALKKLGLPDVGGQLMDIPEI